MFYIPGRSAWRVRHNIDWLLLHPWSFLRPLLKFINQIEKKLVFLGDIEILYEFRVFSYIVVCDMRYYLANFEDSVILNGA